MTGHTATPWIVHKREDEDFGTLVKHIGEEDDVLICETNTSWRYPLVNAANAAFIVRAVNAHEELLAALEGAVEWMSCVEPHLQDGAPFKMNRDAYKTLLAKNGGAR